MFLSLEAGCLFQCVLDSGLVLRLADLNLAHMRLDLIKDHLFSLLKLKQCYSPLVFHDIAKVFLCFQLGLFSFKLSKLCLLCVLLSSKLFLSDYPLWDMLVTKLIPLNKFLSLFFLLFFAFLNRLMLASIFTKLLSTALYLLIHVDLRLFDLLLFLSHFIF